MENHIVIPTVIPVLSYQDGLRAMDWLVQVFGFEKNERMIDDAGILVHGELQTGNGIIVLATPAPAYESPAHHRTHCKRAQKWSEVPWIINGVLVYVDDVETHDQYMKVSNVTLLPEIEEGTLGRRYRVEDLEGHRWFFIERRR